MNASAGDRIRIGTSGRPDRCGEIIQVRGWQRGAPPYLVRFDDGRVRLVVPGLDAVLEPRPFTDLES